MPTKTVGITKDFLEKNRDKIYTKNGKKYIKYKGKEYAINIKYRPRGRAAKSRPEALVTNKYTRAKIPRVPARYRRQRPIKMGPLPEEVILPPKPSKEQRITAIQTALKKQEEDKRKLETQVELEKLQRNLQTQIVASQPGQQNTGLELVAGLIKPPAGFSRVFTETGMIRDISDDEVAKMMNVSQELARANKELERKVNEVKLFGELQKKAQQDIEFLKKENKDTLITVGKEKLGKIMNISPSTKAGLLVDFGVKLPKGMNIQNTKVGDILDTIIEEDRQLGPKVKDLVEDYALKISEKPPNASYVRSDAEVFLANLKKAAESQMIPVSVIGETGQIGTGEQDKINKYGLSNIAIDEYMAPLIPEGYMGAIGADEVADLAKRVNELAEPRMSFILNTDPASKPGKHWTAVYIDARNKSEDKGAQAVEYYDSYGEEPSAGFMRQIKKVIDALTRQFGLDYYLKFKVNKFKDQTANSYNCGYHSMKFLVDRYAGKPFKECTPYNDTKAREADILKFKDKIKKFGYIYKPKE